MLTLASQVIDCYKGLIILDLSKPLLYTELFCFFMAKYMIPKASMLLSLSQFTLI